MVMPRILTIKEPLGNPECPYCYRWVLELGLFSLRIHHWIGNDDLRVFHDHPYPFITFIFKGGYIDCTPGDIIEPLYAPAIRYRKASYKHTVMAKDCWSFLICGFKCRNFKFWSKDLLNSWSPNNYFRKNKYICEDK